MKDLHPGIEAVEDSRRLIGDPEIDAVAIAVPVHLHYQFALAALRAGKHVLLEKPMASSSAECSELITLATEKGLVLMVGHTFIYSESVLKITQIIKSGEIGDILYINSQRLNLGLFQKRINVAWDLAPHDLSIILHILGESPSTVNCQGNAHITPGIEDVTNISLGFSSGRFATIQSSWIEPRKVRQMTIVGTRGMIVFDDVLPNEKLRVYDVRVERPPHYDTFGEFQYSYHYGGSFAPHMEHYEPLKKQCQHFIDCIVNGAQSLTSGEKGLEVVRILEASSGSLKSGGAPVRMEH
jgi:predicted dehydrogenase